MDNLVTRADHEDPTEKRPLDDVIHNPDIPRLHIRIAVVHHDPIVPEPVLFRRPTVDTLVAADLAIVESIQVHALAIDLLEPVADVGAAFHIARGIERRGHGAVLDIHVVHGKADPPAGVPFHPDLRGVPHLQGVAADVLEVVPGEQSAGVARRNVERMRPHPVATDIAKLGAGHAEVRGPFLDQDAARRIVPAGGSS